MDDKKTNSQKIKVSKNGPYLVSGKVPLDKEFIATDNEGTPVKWEKGEKFPAQDNYALCRCGKSKNKPFCDGTHASFNFDGTETASRKKYLEQNDPTVGPDLIMNDAEKLCAVAMFCHRAGNAWDLTEHSDDPKSKEIAIQEACDCPSGRLTACDKKTGKTIEPHFEPSISIVEDMAHKVSGPIWAKGGIMVEASDGYQYENRNRVTLCRCGASKNKPFCDGTHCKIKFGDGDNLLSQ
ncbi:MAG: CDGSH iron-sulfur domain-containing protein [Candidatus Saganbacteria bacterium]|nr:CDGSH iron-sulfur domain-containing protein [Candidatus Saganbacteria bacterium]